MNEIGFICINILTMLLSTINIYNDKKKRDKIDIVSIVTFIAGFICFWYYVTRAVGVTF